MPTTSSCLLIAIAVVQRSFLVDATHQGCTDGCVESHIYRARPALAASAMSCLVTNEDAKD